MKPAFSLRMKILGFLTLLLPALPLAAAINPANFQAIASEQFKLREVSRIVHADKGDPPHLQRVTLVAVVTEVRRGPDYFLGRTIVIDYTVDLTAREKAAKAHAARQGNMPGPQFMGEPEPPTLDENGEFWASLAKAGGRLGNVNRHAGAVVGIGDYTFTGAVFVPVAGPYSFQPPL
jgi:hypothetical protein